MKTLWRFLGTCMPMEDNFPMAVVLCMLAFMLVLVLSKVYEVLALGKPF